MLKVNFSIFNSYKKTFKIPKTTQIHQKYIFLYFFEKDNVNVDFMKKINQ